MKLKRFEYPLKDGEGKTYFGSYTIKENIEPLHFEKEKLVQEFEVDYE